jgi:hypothetical protein
LWQSAGMPSGLGFPPASGQRTARIIIPDRTA